MLIPWFNATTKKLYLIKPGLCYTLMQVKYISCCIFVYNISLTNRKLVFIDFENSIGF